MAKLRTELTALRNTLQEIVDGEEIHTSTTDVIEAFDRILVNSKPESFRAFDLIQKSKENLVATTNHDADSIHVYGRSTDSFDLELAMGVLARVRKNIKEEAMYMLFIKMMAGDYDDDK